MKSYRRYPHKLRRDVRILFLVLASLLVVAFLIKIL